MKNSGTGRQQEGIAMNLTRLEWIEFCADALREDAADRDLTSEALIGEDLKARAEIVCEGDGILCGIDAAEICFELLDSRVRFERLHTDGEAVKRGTRVAEIEGNARSILAAERTALNILYHLSGIATFTRNFVQEASEKGIEVYDTRKTLPLLRKVEKYAVSVGGAKNHRMNLEEAIFVKDNHKVLLGGIDGVVEALRKQTGTDRRIPLIVEVESVEELDKVSVLRPDVVLLDNFELSEIEKAVRKYGEVMTLEVSGGVVIEALDQLARIGVRRVSTSAIVLKARPLPFKLEVLGGLQR